MLDLEAMLIVCLLRNTLTVTFSLLLTKHAHIKRQFIWEIYHRMAGIVANWRVGRNLMLKWDGT